MSDDMHENIRAGYEYMRQRYGSNPPTTLRNHEWYSSPTVIDVGHDRGAAKTMPNTDAMPCRGEVRWSIKQDEGGRIVDRRTEVYTSRGWIDAREVVGVYDAVWASDGAQ